MHIVYHISAGGGPEAFMKNLIPYFDSNGIKVSIVMASKHVDKAHSFPDNIEVFSLNSSPIWPYYAFAIFKRLKLPKYIPAKWIRQQKEKRLIEILEKIDQREPVDIVEFTEGEFINNISKKWKVITRAHGSDWSFRIFCKDQDNSLDIKLKQWQRKQHQLSSANFAISQHTRDHLTEQCKLQKGIIKYIPYPIPLEQFRNAVPVNISGVPEDAPLILSIGRLEHRKGMDVLVKSMNTVWKKIPTAHLLLLGKASQFSLQDLQQLVPKAKKAQIIHPGFVHYSEIPSYYKAADLYVSASQYETFGYTLLEAMASGCPVVCTDRGAMPELIQHRVNGLVVTFGEPERLGNYISEILGDDTQRKLYIDKGFQIAKKYNLSKVGGAIISTYKATFIE